MLFVSHNMGSVKALCNKGIVLCNGIIQTTDSAINAVDYYINTTKLLASSNYVKITEEYRDSGFSKEVVFDSFKLLKESTIYASNEDIVMEIIVHGISSK